MQIARKLSVERLTRIPPVIPSMVSVRRAAGADLKKTTQVAVSAVHNPGIMRTNLRDRPCETIWFAMAKTIVQRTVR